MKVKLLQAHLDGTCDLERGYAMSTLIANDEMELETEYKDGKIGDVRIYRNMNPADLDQLELAMDPKSTKRNRGPYWGSVPAARVKCYRFLDGEPGAAGKQHQKQAESAAVDGTASK